MAKSSIDVQGHRGARALYPENSLPAFKYATEIGADTLELDLAVSKDNVAIVTHDQTVNKNLCQLMDGRPISKSKPIRAMTLKQIQNIDCGSLFNPNFKKQRLVPRTNIPTLVEVFDMITSLSTKNSSKIKFNLEIKSVPALNTYSPSPKEFAKIVVKTVCDFSLQDRVYIQSFDHRVLKEVKKLNTKIKVSLLLAENLVDAASLVKSLKAEAVSPNWQWITKEQVRAIHKAGAKVFTWTCNHVDQWKFALDTHVDGIITDDPAALIKYLKKHGLRK